jgi:hypothetical protein
MTKRMTAEEANKIYKIQQAADRRATLEAAAERTRDDILFLYYSQAPQPPSNHSSLRPQPLP